MLYYANKKEIVNNNNNNNNNNRKCKKRHVLQEKQKQLRIDEMVDIIISSFGADFYWLHKIIHLVNIN